LLGLRRENDQVVRVKKIKCPGVGVMKEKWLWLLGLRRKNA